jgi:hypothetical protein
MAWHLPPGQYGGRNTRTLPDVSTPIGRNDLEPGDILDFPAHHVVLFEAWEADHVHFSYYSFGSTPIRHVTGVSFGDRTLSGWPTSSYVALRYVNVVDDGSDTGTGGRGGGWVGGGGGL